MDLKKIFNNNKAVSPVIGVVLMVAITVILAAAIGSSVFGQGPSESAPQANINIVPVDDGNIKLEHLGGDTVLLGDSESTSIMLARANGTSIELNTTGCPAAFDVGSTYVLSLRDSGNATFNMNDGEFATVKIVDIKTKQLIADKELRF
ncbi:MAG: type IV pilin [Methanosarcina sp.]